MHVHKFALSVNNQCKGREFRLKKMVPVIPWRFDSRQCSSFH